MPTGAPDGGYVLAAVACPDRDLEDVRESLRRLLLRRQRELHWRDEDHERRGMLAKTLAGHTCLTFRVVVRLGAGRRSERRRRHCLARLFPALEAAGVRQVWMDSRNRAQNKLDQAMVRFLRDSQQLRSAFRIDHLPSEQDPMLWAADALCGAFGAHHTSETDEYWLLLADRASLEVLAGD